MRCGPSCSKSMAYPSREGRDMDDRIRRVFKSVFQIPPERIQDSLSPQDVAGWDSLGHIRLVTALQDEFGLEFELDEIMRMGNVGEIRKILAARG